MRKGRLALSALVFLSGCLDYDEVLTLAKDGSGTVRVDMVVDLAFSAKLHAITAPEGAEEKGAEDADDPYKMLVTKEEIKKQVQGVDGVTIKQCLVEETAPQKTHVKLEVEFKSLDALRKTTGFQARELRFEEKDGNVEATYKIDARFLKELGLVVGPDDPAPATDQEKKMRKVVDEATKEAGARFTVHFPEKPTKTTGKADENDEKAVRLEVPKKDAKAHAAVAKDPLVLQATLPRKDMDVLLKPPAAPEKKAPAPSPRPKEDDE